MLANMTQQGRGEGYPIKAVVVINQAPDDIGVFAGAADLFVHLHGVSPWVMNGRSSRPGTSRCLHGRSSQPARIWCSVESRTRTVWVLESLGDLPERVEIIINNHIITVNI